MTEFAPTALQAVYPAVKPHESSMKVSGIIGDARHGGGYHLSRNVLLARGLTGDYSIQAPADKRGDGDACSAIDLGFDPAAMRRVTGRLRAACENDDPRIAPVREFIGTLDGRNVCGYNRVATGNGTRSRVGWVPSRFSDSSHLWHVHISILRAYSNDADRMLAVAEVVAGLNPGTLVKLPTSGGTVNGRTSTTSIGDDVTTLHEGKVVFQPTALALGPTRKQVPLIDKDTPSLLNEGDTGDGALIVLPFANVRTTGLTGSGQVFGDWVIYDNKGKRVGAAPGTFSEVDATKGVTYLKCAWPFKLGKNRRLRLEAYTDQSAGVAVTQVNSSVLSWKV